MSHPPKPTTFDFKTILKCSKDVAEETNWIECQEKSYFPHPLRELYLRHLTFEEATREPFLTWEDVP